jgi:Glycosyltransferase WbsX
VWHYWFGRGRKILEKPIEMVLSKKLNFKYCLSWANHSWMDKSKNKLLIKQEYLGASDYLDFFQDSRRHFETENYIKIDNKPVFLIFDPAGIPDLEIFLSTWDQAARNHGFSGIYFIGDKLAADSPLAVHFDGVSNGFAFWTNRKKMIYNFIKEKARTKLGLCWSPQMYEYESMLIDAIPKHAGAKYIPTVISGWDTTPRHGKRGAIFFDFNKRTFQAHLSEVSRFILEANPNNKIIFLKSWNEWAEGNCIEPDNISGYSLLEAYRDNIESLHEALSYADHNKSVPIDIHSRSSSKD